MKTILFLCASLLLAFALWQTPSVAMERAPAPSSEGELKGIVLDINNSRVAGAKVTVESRGAQFEEQSDAEGAYTFKLPAGEYRLTIEADGFKLYRKRVRIAADKTETISTTLQVAPPTGTLKIK
jgi:uncharacterized membrane protein